VLDELDSMRAFENQWREVIRPTLPTTAGAGLFMGTPKRLQAALPARKLVRTNPNYQAFHFMSFDNPFLIPGELEELRGEMTATQYAQEMLAEYHKMEGLIYEEFRPGRAH